MHDKELYLNSTVIKIKGKNWDASILQFCAQITLRALRWLHCQNPGDEFSPSVKVIHYLVFFLFFHFSAYLDSDEFLCTHCRICVYEVI